MFAGFFMFWESQPHLQKLIHKNEGNATLDSYVKA